MTNNYLQKSNSIFLSKFYTYAQFVARERFQICISKNTFYYNRNTRRHATLPSDIKSLRMKIEIKIMI